MKTIFLKFNGGMNVRPTILINGKKVKLKKNDLGGLEAIYETTESHVNVKIYKYLELAGRLWWFFSLLFWAISIFGIFDSRYDKRCISLDAEFDISLTGDITEVILKPNREVVQGKAFEVETPASYVEKSNNYFVDVKVKKRRKIMKLVKWLTALGIIIAGVVTVVVLFII